MHRRLGEADKIIGELNANLEDYQAIKAEYHGNRKVHAGLMDSMASLHLACTQSLANIYGKHMGVLHCFASLSL